MENLILKSNSVPPIFDEKKLWEILHYTDLDENPAFEAHKSSCIYEIHSGAKGVSKSFGGAIITIYRIVNEKNFNSIWTRNQYNHIQNTLKPMFIKVLDFLAEVHNLDFRPYFVIYNKLLVWNYNDGGEGRAIFFENFEKVQSFQGITLRKNFFRFGELVIDEPIEDPTVYNKNSEDLYRIYQIQQEKLPLIIANTVFRSKTEPDFKIKIKFFYNLFTTEHFLVQNYHLKVIDFLDQETKEIKPGFIELMLDQKFLQKFDPNFKDGLGLCVTMYSKFFVKSSEFNDFQLKNLKDLEKNNYGLWVITVVGLSFEDNEFKKEREFLRPYIEKACKISENEFIELIKLGKITDIFDGFDPGKYDNASYCRVALDDEGKIYILDAFEDLKKFFKQFSRRKNAFPSNQDIHQILITIINQNNNWFLKQLNNAYSWNHKLNPNNFKSNLLTDNSYAIEMIQKDLIEKANYQIQVFPAFRFASKKINFNIEARQNWLKSILSYKLFYYLEKNEVTLLLKNLSLQVIEVGEQKRNEKIRPRIYDLINAFEMASCILSQIQILKIRQISQLNNYE